MPAAYSWESEAQVARPKKEGLEYFSIDTDITNDDKVKLIKAKYGLTGFAIVILLLTKIYHNGYFYPWSEDEQYLFADDARVEVNVVNNVVNDCINRGFFNKTIYDQYGVLTSRGIQKRFLQACQRRKEVVVYREYFLAEDYIKELAKDNVTIICINVDDNSVNDNIMYAEIPQRESKAFNDDDNNARVREGERQEEKTPEEIKTAELYSIIENEFGPVRSGIESDSINDMIDSYPRDWIIEAIRKAVLNKARNTTYVVKILSGWRSEGHRDTDRPWEANNYKSKPHRDITQECRAAPDPNCPKCHGSGYREYTTDDGNGHPLSGRYKCPCWKESVEWRKIFLKRAAG